MASLSYPLVALVDDDEVVRDSMRAVLKSRRYAVLDFPSGRNFLAWAQPQRPSCVVLDVHMPEMTGIQVVVALRDRGDETPAILLTGRRDNLLAARARALAVPLLDKPISHKVLFAAIARAIALPV